MNVLADTSVWVAHFRQANDHLIGLLEAGLVRCHPYVIAELACGTPPNRRAIIGMLEELEGVPLARHAELLQLIERRALNGRGCGLVDVALLASVLLDGQTLLWTLDRWLDDLAAGLACAYRPGAAL